LPAPHHSETLTIALFSGLLISAWPVIAAAAASVGTPPRSGNITNAGAKSLFNGISFSVADQSASPVVVES
jgi:hypothetical protein